MLRAALFLAFGFSSTFPLSSTVRATDWFVAPGPATGDGTRTRPFHDPWRALAVASAGDVIHVARGTYFGRHDRSTWNLDRPNVTLLGGYDPAFTQRDPWMQPSVFAHHPDYEGTSESHLFLGRDDHTGSVIDGFVFDGAGRNTYEPEPPYSLLSGLNQVGALFSLASPRVVVRHCTFLNSRSGAVELRGEGSRFENNRLLNHFSAPMLVLRQTGREVTEPIVVRNNTFAFAWDDADPPMGRGGEKGVAIRIGAAARIEGNAFVGCGNAGIALFVPPAQVAIERNAFWLTMRACVAAREGVREYVLAESNLEEIEDLGFQACSGNRAVALTLGGLPPVWVDGVTKHLLLAYTKVASADLEALRRSLGFAEVSRSTSDDLGPVAPRLSAEDVTAGFVAEEWGARPMPLEPHAFPDAPLAPARAYEPIAWDALFAPGDLDGKPVELRVGIGNENHGFLLAGVTKETHFGFYVHHPGASSAEIAHVFTRRFGGVHRQWDDAHKSNDARSIDDWYLLRGVLRETGRHQRGTIEVEAIVPAEPPARVAPARPVGRDWFVVRGSSGGDGSREKPFRDPFQALERVSPGDRLHVAEGDYHGKLRGARFEIFVSHVELLGGYDASFQERDPWRRPTRLVLSPEVDEERRKSHGGTFFLTTEPVEGVILDGFGFDGRSVNAYVNDDPAAGLNLGGSPIAPLLQWVGKDATIRNCVFANASGSAVQLSCPSGTFENNVVVNSSGVGLQLTASGSGNWVLRRNTFLFAMDPTGRGHRSSAAGTLLILRGQAKVRLEENVFAFADVCAVRATMPRHRLALDRNVFFANPLLDLTDGGTVFLHANVWERRIVDAGFRSIVDNERVWPAGLALDRQYVDRVLPRSFGQATHYDRDDWVRVVQAVGAAVLPPEESVSEATRAVESREERKEPTLEDLMKELEGLKKESAASHAKPEGPPYAPAYAFEAALALVGAEDASARGTRRIALPVPAGK